MQNLHNHDRAELPGADHFARRRIAGSSAGGQDPSAESRTMRVRIARKPAVVLLTLWKRRRSLRAFSWLGLGSEDLERLRCSAEAPTSITRWQRSALCGSRRINTWSTAVRMEARSFRRGEEKNFRNLLTAFSWKALHPMATRTALRAWSRHESRATDSSG